jgi:DNA invertase Pin-like site-specific DNA recombinase
VIALGYARCSTQEQADAGNGLAAQEKAIEVVPFAVELRGGDPVIS